ncbi:MAG TPA: hypothetical protein VHM19_08935, partial [Polyangiales bacterium]|nr:hypothetical protein [Polyangiales bacterium]
PINPMTGKDIEITNEEEQLISVADKYPTPRAPVYGKHGQVIGHEDAYTAQQSQSAHRGGGKTRDDDAYETALIEFGKVTRRLLAIGRQHERSVLVLEAYYGDRGEQCEQPRRWETKDGERVVEVVIAAAVGRIVALYPLTGAGRELLRLSEPTPGKGKKTRKKQAQAPSANLRMTKIARLENIVRQPQGQQQLELLGRAQHEAELMLHEAHERWNTVSGHNRPRTAIEVLKRRADEQARHGHRAG